MPPCSGLGLDGRKVASEASPAELWTSPRSVTPSGQGTPISVETVVKTITVGNSRSLRPNDSDADRERQLSRIPPCEKAAARFQMLIRYRSPPESSAGDTVGSQQPTVREDKTPDFKALKGQGPGSNGTRSSVCEERRRRSSLSRPEAQTTHGLFFDAGTKRRSRRIQLLPWLQKPSKRWRQVCGRSRSRDFALWNIAEISVNGEQYQIAPAIDEVQSYIPAPRADRRKTAGRATPSTTASRSPRATKPKKSETHEKLEDISAAFWLALRCCLDRRRRLFDGKPGDES